MQHKKIYVIVILIFSALLACSNTTAINTKSRSSIEGFWELVLFEEVVEIFFHGKLLSSVSETKYPGGSNTPQDSISNSVSIITKDTITFYTGTVDCNRLSSKHIYMLRGDTIVDDYYYNIGKIFQNFMTYEYSGNTLLINEYANTTKSDTMIVEKEIWHYKEIADSTLLPSWMRTQCTDL